MSKYRAVFRTSFLNSLAYRVNFLLWGFNELIDTLVFLFVWIFIFGERQSIGGFTLPQTVTYMIGVGMINTIISSNIGRNLSRLTKGGGLSNLLVKPVNVPLSLFIKNFCLATANYCHSLFSLPGSGFLFSRQVYFCQSADLFIVVYYFFITCFCNQ